MDILVTYDISTVDIDGPQRLARVAAVCERYGTRVQYSVFECRISATSFQVLIGDILDTIDAKMDSVRIYRFSGNLNDSCTKLGRGATRELGDPWIL